MTHLQLYVDCASVQLIDNFVKYLTNEKAAGPDGLTLYIHANPGDF